MDDAASRNDEGTTAPTSTPGAIDAVVLARVLAALLQPGHLEDAITGAMVDLGEALDVDRVYVFENGRDETTGEPTCSQRFEWARDAIEPQIDNPELQSIPYSAFTQRWYSVLGSGGAIVGNVDSFPEDERAILEPQDIDSILVVPVLIEGAFWGFMGFDVCHRLRSWTDPDIDVLRAAAAAFGNAVRARRAEAILAETAILFESTHDGIALVDRDWRVVRYNRAMAELAGVGDSTSWEFARVAYPAGPDAPSLDAVVESLDHADTWQGEARVGPVETGASYVWLTISRLPETALSARAKYAVVCTNINSLKATQARLVHQGHHDALTGLPNRTRLAQHLRHAAVRARAEHRRLAVLFADLDGFKTVNDSIGHPEGDQLLIAFARRARRVLRDSDMLARLGGDEFVAVLEGIDQAAEAASVADRLVEASTHAYALPSGREVFSTISLGIAVYPDDTRDVDELVQFADAAMYGAKSDGRSRHQRYSSDLTRAARDRLDLETALRRAIENVELEVWFQPQYDVTTERIVGAEALLRWHHEGSPVPPSRFVPLAEEIGSIAPLTVHSLRETCRMWRRLADAGHETLRMAVNLSPVQFRGRDVVPVLNECLSAFDVPPGAIEVELTESTLMAHPASLGDALRELRSLGVRIAIDDFGTGYSSLGALRSYPIDRLKIDRSFITDVPGDAGAVAIAETIIAMAHILGLDTVAEGVETRAQLEFLQARGCEVCQGWLYAPALRGDDFLARVTGDTAS